MRAVPQFGRSGLKTSASPIFICTFELRFAYYELSIYRVLEDCFGSRRSDRAANQVLFLYELLMTKKGAKDFCVDLPLRSPARLGFCRDDRRKSTYSIYGRRWRP